MSASIQIIALNGGTVAKSTTITDAQAVHFIALVDAIKTAREVIRFTEGQQDVQHVSGTVDQVHPLTVRQLLPRLDKLLSQKLPVHPSMYQGAGHLKNANDPQVNHNASRMDGVEVTPTLDSLAPITALYGSHLQAGRDLGMLLTNENQPYDRVELVGGPTARQLRWR